MVAFYTLSGSRVFFWYITPIYPLYAVFFAAAFVHAADRFASSPERERVWRMIVLPVVALALLFGCYKPMTYYRTWQNTQRNVHRAMGLFLRQTADPGDLVAAEDIGLIGYYSRLRILDRDGLVSPEAVPYNAAGDYLGLDHGLSAQVGSGVSGFADERVYHRFRVSGSLPDENRVFVQRGRIPAICPPREQRATR